MKSKDQQLLEEAYNKIEEEQWKKHMANLNKQMNEHPTMNLDEVIKKVLNDIKHGNEQVGEVLDNCNVDYGIDGLTVAKELLKRGLMDKEVLNNYISSER